MPYPTTLISWAEVAASGVVLVADHLRVPMTEMESVEAELGTEPHGQAGSLAERLAVGFDAAGHLVGRVAFANATDGQRKRMRAGYFEATTQGSGQSEELVAAITFSPALQNAPLMYFTLRYLSTSTGRPEYVTWGSQVTNVSANVIIQPAASGGLLTPGVPFGVYWLAIESTFDATQLGF